MKEVFPRVPDFICHFHFLRDIGKDLLDEEYTIIRKRLTKYSTQTFLNNIALPLKEVVEDSDSVVNDIQERINGKSKGGAMPKYTANVSAFVLIKWILNGKKQGKGYGYPFDRPLLNLYQRLKTTNEVVDVLRSLRFEDDRKEKRIYGKLWRKINQIVNDRELKTAVNLMIEKKAKVFDKLRTAMQITELMGSDGLNDAGKNSLPTIEKNVKAFSKWLENGGNGNNSREKDYRKMREQISKYWEKLFSDPITINTKFGKIIIQPQRTNNILERFFRDLKRMYRKKPVLIH